MASIRVGLAQINPVVGDLDGNVDRILAVIASAEAQGCDLVALPELALTGYPPEDLLLRPSFVRDTRAALDRVVAATRRTVVVVGFPEAGGHDAHASTDHAENADGDGRGAIATLHNSAAVCAEGRLLGVYRKRALPNYSVFDEQRYFVAGAEPLALFRIAGVDVGVSICEDAWSPEGPIAALGRGGADLIVNINASPFNTGKASARQSVLAERAREADAAIAYVNQVGGQDELVFDGDSMVVDRAGSVVFRAPQFRAGLHVVDIEIPVEGDRPSLPIIEIPGAPAHRSPVEAATVAPRLSPEAEVWEALVLGTGDFVRKNGFTDVVIGLSGGIDSALVAAIATEALGSAHVHGVLMPSRYSSEHSISDAIALADNLGIEHRTIPIEPAHVALMEMLAPSYAGHSIGLAEENLQSRLRAVILMGLSNAFGWLLLNTGNKSESSVGYSTLYGDSAGGYAVIKDVSKLLVYRLCRQRNLSAGREIIPESVLIKPPSAELRPDQRDDQSLPPYDQLDPILALYVEGDRSAEEIIAAGHDPATVERIVRLVDLAEYKRRQSPPGPRVTAKGFGKDRRLPIVNRYRR
ncbi:MAG: NAD+ synthase [Acidobacteria bacterium]|nr:NAD+ synthase [Acidobacteriota bacterium]